MLNKSSISASHYFVATDSFGLSQALPPDICLVTTSRSQWIMVSESPSPINNPYFDKTKLLNRKLMQ